MKLKAVLGGQAARFIRIIEPVGSLFIPDFVKAIQEKYRFVTIPKSLAEFDRTKGVKFEHGVVKRNDANVVLERLQIYTNGLILDTRVYSEEADEILDEMIAWAIKDMGLRHDTDAPTMKSYVSNVEVEMKNPFPAMRSKVSDTITHGVSGRLASYGIEADSYEELAVSFHVDAMSYKMPFPTSFKLERREGFPFSANVFFSSAPLKTADHLALLERIEGSL